MTRNAPALPLSAQRTRRLEWRASSPSTNSELVALSAAGEAEWPHLSVLVTDHQTSGRGRLDRVWSSPAGSGLAISVLLRPRIPRESWGWFSLLAGTAMTEAVAAALTTGGAEASAASLKWPNDVLVGGKKICGILAEITPEGAVVIGAGLNTAMTSEQMPVERATSLAVAGGLTDPDPVLARYLERLGALYGALEAANGDAVGSGLRDRAQRRCDTVGRRVRAELPDGNFVHGRATGLDATGMLLVRADGAAPGAAPRRLSAADITHLRTPDAAGS